MTLSKPNPPWSGELRVASIRPETHDVKTLRLVPPDAPPIPFTFKPGQFLTVRAELAGKRITRAYTISSAPHISDFVEITVRRASSGKLSTHLTEAVAPDDVLNIRAPFGDFVFTGEGSDSIVMIAGGVGVCPFISILRHLTHIRWPGDAWLLYSMRTPEDFIDRAELESITTLHPRFRVLPTVTRECDAEWKGMRGRFTGPRLRELIPDPTSHLYHVCGPAPMIEDTISLLREIGVGEDRIHKEAF